MDQNKIDDLIIKFIEDTISNEESAVLKSWLQDDENNAYFKTFIELNYLIDIKQDFNYQSSLQAVKTSIMVSSKNRNLLILKYAVAASILLLISLPLLVNKDHSTPVVVINDIKTGTDKATLTLEDGSNIILEKGQNYSHENINSNGEELIYDPIVNQNSDIDYNYLTIPRGGQFFVKLSDGTQIWLNSESQIKYPKAFNEGQDRIVELVYGEAYFDVSPSIIHKGAAFKVRTMGQTTKVFGTEFNINAYKNETNIYTSLIEGKVSVGDGRSNKVLNPGEQSILNTKHSKFSVTNIDVLEITAWKNGLFIFDNKPLGEMMKILSRWYNLEVSFEIPAKQHIKFSGTLNRSDHIHELLDNLEKTGEVNFEISDHSILIK